MRENKRAKRPKIERAEPQRSVGAAMRSKASESNGTAKANGATHQNGERSKEWTQARDASYEAINDGYRVIDEYMRQGQRLAESFWLPSADARPGGPELTGMMNRFLRSAGDMGSAWLEMMTEWTRTPDARDAVPRGTAGGFGVGARNGHSAPGTSGETDARARLSLHIESSRPVSVSIDAPRDLHDVELHVLVTANPRAQPITSVSLEARSDGLTTLRLGIPPTQTAGVYAGVLIDRRRQTPVGTVTVTVQ